GRVALRRNIGAADHSVTVNQNLRRHWLQRSSPPRLRRGWDRLAVPLGRRLVKEAASLLRYPRACGRKFVRRKEFYWRAANSRASKSESLYFPAPLRHDRDFGDLTGMREEKIQICALCAAFKTLEVFDNSENARLRADVDFVCECALGRRKFGLF